MEHFFEMAGKLIEFYREKRHKKGSDVYSVRLFCLNEDGTKICSYPTYKRLSSGSVVKNEGFYYVLCNKLNIPFDVPYTLSGDAIPNYENQLCDLLEGQKRYELKSFVEYYQHIFEVLPGSIVTSELKDFTNFVSCIVNKDNQPFKLDSLYALCSVTSNERFAHWMKVLLIYYSINQDSFSVLSDDIKKYNIDEQDVFRMTSFLLN